MASSYEESYKKCLLVHLDQELCMEKYGKFVRKTKNLIFILEDLTLKMKYLSSFYLSYASARYVLRDVKEPKFFMFVSEPNIKEEDFSEDMGIIIQKLIHCLISSFKMTILIYEATQNNDYTSIVIKLCCKFLKCAFKAAAVFTIPDHEHKPSQKFLNDGKSAMQNLAMILIIISKCMIFEILEEILPPMINDMLGNPIIKVFSNCLLGHRRTSKAASTLLLNHFSDINRIRLLQERNSKKSKLLMSLFDDIFEALTLFPDEIENTQKKFLKSVAKNLIELVQTTIDCYNHLLVLKSLFLALHNESHLVHYGLVSILPHLFNAFEFLLQSSLESKIWYLLLETVLTAINSLSPASYVFLLPHIELIVKAVMFSLKENSDLVQKALSVFENLVDVVDFDYINSCILPVKKDFLNILYDTLYNSTGRSSEITLRILGKMGGYNRDKMEHVNHLTDDLKSYVSGTSGPLLHINCKEGFLNLPMARVIDHAFKGLFSFKDDDSKKHCWSLVETFLSCHIKHYDRRHLRSSSSKVLRCGDDENQDYCCVLKTAFKSMFVSAEMPCLSDKVGPFMVKVIKCLIRYSLIIDKNKDLKLLIDAAMLIACLPKDYDDEIQINTLRIIINKACEFYRIEEVWTSSFFNYIVEEIIFLLYGQTKRQKLVGCKAVQFFLKKTSWKWKVTNVHRFVRPLLNTEVVLEGSHSFTSKVILQDFLLQCFASSNKNKIWKIDLTKIYNRLKNLLIYDMVSSNYHIREQARSTMTFMFRILKSKLRNKNSEVTAETNRETENREITGKNKIIDKNIKIADTNSDKTDQNSQVTDKNRKETVPSSEVGDKNREECSTKVKSKEARRNEYRENSNKPLSKKCTQGSKVPEIILLPKFCFLIDNLVYLHEDFDFCMRLKMPLFHTDTDNEKDRILFEELKSLCIINEHSIHTQSDVRRCCGALHTLCFNFINKQNLDDLFMVITNALLSPVPEISDSAVKCLQFIKEHISTKMMYDWTCGFLNPLIKGNSIQRYHLCYLKYFIKNFDNWCQKSLLDALMKHLEMWKNNTINLCQTIFMTKGCSLALVVNFHLGADLINVLNLMHITDDYVIKNVMGTIFEIEQYFKMTKDNPLKEPYMTFCQKFPIQVVKIIVSNLKYNAKADVTHFADFLKTEECDVFRLSIKENYLISLGISERLSYVLQILKYVVKYNDQWLLDKRTLMEKLCLEWNTNKLYLKPRMQAMCDLKNFKLLAKFLLNFFFYNHENLNILFDLMKAFVCPFASSFTFLKDFVLNIVAKEYKITWKAEAFFKFQSYFMNLKGSEDFKIHYLIKILQFLFIPSFSESFKNGEGEELLKECNKINSLDVLKKFVHCVRNFIDHSEVVKLMFLKFSIIMAQNFQKLGNYNIFIEEAKKLAESSLNQKNTLETCVHHSFLLLLTIQKEDWNMNIQRAFLLKLFTTYRTGGQHIVQQALFLSMSSFHDAVLSPCFDYVIRSENFDLIVIYYETFYCFRHKFIKPMIQRAVKIEGFKDLKEQKMAVDLIEVIIKWGKKQYLTARNSGASVLEKSSGEISAGDAKLAVDLLLRIACLLKVDSDSFQKSLSKKSASLLKDVFELKIFPLTDLEFGDWVDDFLGEISKESKKYENCEIFTLMTSFLTRGCGKKPLKSFVKHLQTHFEDLLRCSEVKVLESLYRFLSNLISKFPPGKFDAEFGGLYKHIEILCTNETYFLCNSKASLVEAVGGYFQSCLDHLRSYYLTKLLSVLTSNCPFYDNKTTLNVALGFLKKLFFSISEDDRRKLFIIMHSLISTVSHVEVMLKIIDIMELSIAYLKEKEINRKLSTHLVDQISKLFEEICNKINTTFSQNKDVCSRFFEVMIKLRKNVCYIRVINVFAVFGTFTSHSEIRKKCFHFVAEELDYNLFWGISYICDERWKVYGSLFWLKLYINLVSVMFRDVYITSNAPKSRFRTKELVPFSTLVELCYSDESLAKYICTELFHSIWNILSKGKKKELFTKLQSFILIPPEQYNLHDVLIPVALKCNPEFVYNIDPKLICKSYPMQVHCCMLLESIISSQEFLSEETCNKIINILPYIYHQLEESDVLYSFIENSVYYSDSTVQAVLHYKNGNIYKAYEFFKEIKAAFIGKVQAHTTSHEMEFCMNQMIRCASELARWDDSTDIPSSSLMQYVCPLSKSNILIESPFEDIIIKSKFCKLKNEDTMTLRDEKNYDVIHRCIKEWKSLPRNFLSKSHYSLLQMMQQLTELVEAGHLVKNRDLDLFAEEVKTISSRWNSRPYLLSDDFSFITEIFNVRQKSLENVALRCNAPSVKNVACIATHASNHYAIELSSIAMQFQNILVTNVGCKNYSLQNAYQLLEMKLSNLLSKVQKSVTQKNKDNLFKKTSYLFGNNREIINYFDNEKRLLLSVHKMEIHAALGRNDVDTETSEIIAKNPRIGKAFFILGEFCEKSFFQSHKVKDALISMHCLLKACRLCTAFESHKLIPRILYLLEFDDENYSIAEVLRKGLRCDICDKYWIPYLPFLISCLHHSIVQEKPTLSNLLTDILQKLSLQYPQQVFFSLNSLSGIQPVERNGRKCDEIISQIRKRHPVLTFKLQEVSNIFGHFKTNAYDMYCQTVRQALDKAYTFVFQNFKNGHNVFDAAEILEYLKTDFVSKVHSIHKSRRQSQDILESIDVFKSLEDCASDAIICLLKKSINLFSKVSMRFQPRSFLLDDKFPALSSHFLDSEAVLFDHLHLVDHSSVIKIHKILPKIEVLKRNKSFLYKINIRGHDGKDYPYLIMNDVSREESVNTVKIMQLLENLNPFLEKNVECARNFLKFHFPRIVFINSHVKLMPHNYGQISLQYVYQMHTMDFSPADNFFELLFQHPDIYRNVHYVHHMFKSIEMQASKKKKTTVLDKLYSSPLDYFNFRQKVLKDISMLSAAEFLHICSNKQMLIHKSVDGLSSALHLELNFEEMQTTSSLMTPCMRNFLGPFRIGVVAENILHIVSCLKENEKSWRFARPLLHLMKKSYSEKDFNEMQKFVDIFVNKLKCVNKTEVQRFLESKTSFNLCHANQFVHLTF